MQTKILMMLSVAFLSQVSVAAPIVKTWVNPECATGSCELKGIKLYIEKELKSTTAGNSMAAEIETSSKEVLNKYVFVQYIRGCIFQENDKGQRRLAMREFLGKQNQPFKHSQWEIDSASDADPIYWSSPAAGWDDLRGFEVPRNAGYQVMNPISTGSGGSWAGKVSNLKEAKIYVNDLPSMTQLTMKPDMSWIVQNASLEFKICLHDVKDVQKSVDDARTDIANPITCMSWSSNYVYEPTKFKIVEKKEVHPYCLN